MAEKFAIDYAASFDRCAARFEVITDDEQRNNARTSLVHTLRQRSFHYENLNRYQLALDLLQVASAQAKQLPLPRLWKAALPPTSGGAHS